MQIFESRQTVATHLGCVWDNVTILTSHREARGSISLVITVHSGLEEKETGDC